MDVLTDILASLRLNGGIVFDAEMRGDWCVRSQYSPEHCAPYFPVPEQIISYHYVRRGQLYAELPEGTRVHAREGSMILFPRNDAHMIYTRPGLPPQDLADVTTRPTDGSPSVILYDQPGEQTALFCGWLGVLSGNHPLLEALPPVMLFDGGSGEASEWMASSLRIAAGELQYDAALVAKMSELFFARAVRDYVENLGPGEGGWLNGLRDPAVAKALSVIHARYAEELDVDEMARAAGVSRTVLGERFASLLGEPPMRYCARWRMRTAANMLQDGKHNNANIAYAVGFNSEAAFNRAFKREYGDPPATWKRRVDAEARARQSAEQGELPQQKIRYCEAHDGTRLAYSTVGSGLPLVKTANWLNHLEFDFESPIWIPWLKELTRDFSLLRYDERGNGLSDWNTPELSLDAFVDDLACVVDDAGLDQFDLFGISQGGPVAIAYAVRNPERVRRIVLCGAYAAGWRARGETAEIDRREAMVTLTRLGWGSDNPAYRQLFTSVYIPGANAKQANWYNELQRRSTSPDNAADLMRVLSELDVRDLLSQVQAKTIVFHARDDLAVPFSQGELLAREIPGATFVPLDSRNHVLLGEEPAFRALMNGMRRFLTAP